MRRNRWNRVLATCAAAFVVISIPAQGSAELKAWDQEEVALLAKQLSEAVTSLRQASINDPRLRQSRRRADKDLLDTMRLLEQACRQLAGKLEAGEDRAQTTGVGKKIGMLIRRAQMEARKVMISESQWIAIDPAVDLINRISPYYSDESPLLPPSQQR